MSKNAPFSEIVSELKQICNRKQSGTLYITSQDNRSAQVVVEHGQIVFLYYYNKRGRDALRLMLEISHGRYRFQEGMVPPARSADLHVGEVLHYLSAASGAIEAEIHELVPQTADDPSPGTGSQAILSEEVKQRLESELALYIGPMAAIICEECFRTAGDLIDAVEMLASEIPDTAQVEQFKAAVLDS